MASVIALVTRRRHEGRRTIEIIQGQVYKTTNREYKIFGSKNFMVKPRAIRNKYSDQEYTTMAQIYLEFADQNVSLEDYWVEFTRRLPNSLASREGFICYICIIRGLDVTNPYKGFNNPAQRLVQILNTIDPDRFEPESNIEDKIDALLATV
jgi:hypothetical protein